MAVKAGIFKKLLNRNKTKLRAAGAGLIGATGGAGVGAYEGHRYNEGDSLATGYIPVKDAEQRKKNVRRGAAAYLAGKKGDIRYAKSKRETNNRWRNTRKENKAKRDKYWEDFHSRWESNYGSGSSGRSSSGSSGSSSGYGSGGYKSKASSSATSSAHSALKDLDIDLGHIKSKADFKKAHRDHAKKLHPDVNKAKDATAKFQKFNNAMEDLKNSDWHDKLAFMINSLGLEKLAYTRRGER